MRVLLRCAQVSAATSSLMVLFSSSAALVGFVVLGRVNPPYALVLGGTSAAASLLGVLMVADLVSACVECSVRGERARGRGERLPTWWFVPRR